MGQAVADLPDPLESANPVEAQSADDLLSQMAGDEIDRLLAEADSEPAPAAQPAPPASQVEAIPAPEAPPAASVDLDAILQIAVADHEAAVQRSALIENAVQAPVESAPVDHSPQIELGEAVKRVPLFLRPLEWLSSPLDPWPDQIREILGKIGVVTLINALAVIAYVLIVRRHHH